MHRNSVNYIGQPLHFGQVMKSDLFFSFKITESNVCVGVADRGERQYIYEVFPQSCHKFYEHFWKILLENTYSSFFLTALVKEILIVKPISI